MLDIRREHPGQKLVVSPSLGSASRNHAVTLNVLGTSVRVYRVGTDGDFAALLDIYRRYAPVVDAFGFGGGEFGVVCGDRTYAFREGRHVRAAAAGTPVADGNGVKSILERRAVAAVAEAGVPLHRARALCVSAMDRRAMAEALVAHGCDTVFGDLIFSLGVPLPIGRLTALDHLGRVLLPIVTQLPYRVLYPTGTKQEGAPVGRHASRLAAADIIAGDFHWIRCNLPADLRGKVIVTNTTTAADVALLGERGLRLLVTGAPRLEGRSFGTNVIEAMLLAVLGKDAARATPADFERLIDAIPLRPDVTWLNPQGADTVRVGRHAV